MEGTCVVNATCKEELPKFFPYGSPCSVAGGGSFRVPWLWGEHSQGRAASGYSASRFWHFMWDMLGYPFSLEVEGHGKSQWAWIKFLFHWSMTEACDLSESSCFYLWNVPLNVVTPMVTWLRGRLALEFLHLSRDYFIVQSTWLICLKFFQTFNYYNLVFNLF